MNFAKKTMSFALASVMVASSLLTGTSALAAEKKVITPMTSTSQAIVATVKDNQVKVTATIHSHLQQQVTMLLH